MYTNKVVEDHPNIDQLGLMAISIELIFFSKDRDRNLSKGAGKLFASALISE